LSALAVIALLLRRPVGANEDATAAIAIEH
jgi:hypothetical protein